MAPERILTEAEVQQLYDEGRYVYICNGGVYDVKVEEIMHPGGRDVSCLLLNGTRAVRFDVCGAETPPLLAARGADMPRMGLHAMHDAPCTASCGLGPFLFVAHQMISIAHGVAWRRQPVDMLHGPHIPQVVTWGDLGGMPYAAQWETLTCSA